jgi:hypothetical protein
MAAAGLLKPVLDPRHVSLVYVPVSPTAGHCGDKRSLSMLRLQRPTIEASTMRTSQCQII